MQTPTMPPTAQLEPQQTRGEADFVPVERQLRPASQLPGRDLSIFLLLLAAVDITSVLHIYNLVRLYNEFLFLGVGLFFLLCAILLLLLHWRMPDLKRPLPLITLLICLGIAAGSIYLLMRSASHAPDWYAASLSQGSMLGVMAVRVMMLGCITGVALAAVALGYARDDLVRKIGLPVLAGAWFVLSVVMLHFLTDGTNDPATASWAALLGAGWPMLMGLAGLLIVVALLTRVGARAFMVTTLAAGVALRLLALPTVQISTAYGDMLPLVQMATARALQGQNPYIVYQMPWELPLTYWPLTWLSYAPFTALGLDVRLANLLLAPALCALLWRRASGPGAWACYAAGLLYLIPAILQWDLTTEAPVFWLWLAFALGLASWSAPWPGIGIGLAIACSPLALPFAPFLLAHWLAKNLRHATVNFVAAVIAAALLILPFLLWDFGGFWNGAIRWFNDIDVLPRLKWDTDRSWLYQVGVAAPFWINGLEHWLKAIQVVLVGGLFFLSVRARPDLARALRWGTAAFLIFMVFNPVIWPYLYTPALLGMVFAMSYAGQDQ